MPSVEDHQQLPRLEARVLGQGDAWKVTDFVCRAGPEDRKFEEEHDTFSIAAVISGTFVYRGSAGTHLLHPGSLLLGNHGTCYECGHDHSRGDRCLAFQVTPELFGEIAASAGGGAGFSFPTGMVPAGGALGSSLVATLAACDDPLRAEELALALVETVVAHLSEETPSVHQVSSRDARRISAALRHLEMNYADPVELDALARAAGMSKYHFIRTFRSVVGMTPYQFVLETRLREVALRLVRSAVPVSAAALEAGFGDLSTFNARFRARFGVNPTAFRATHRGRA